MCGIVGFWDFKNQLSSAQGLSIIQDMGQAIIARGPDSSGTWQHAASGLVFGHRRLAIVDLTSTGHQPMVSQSGRTVITYNGEIYNTQELRQQLTAQGIHFKGTSDTEVIVEACEHWGLETTVQKLIGMFAFAIWSDIHQKLFLVRDRLGKKPLYWGRHGDMILFGSQLKSLYRHPNWHGIINPESLALYFQYNYVPAPQTIFKNTHKLLPAHIMTIDATGQIQQYNYWPLTNIIDQAKKQAFQGTPEQATDEFESILSDAVKRRMIADVPLGAFLSGGIDSSAIVALMQAHSTQPIKTFSIGFNEPEYDEAKYAKVIANHLGTDHHELYLPIDDAVEIIPDLPEWFDEPFADSSQLPTYLVSKLARHHVTVSLSGDGGDELLAGYNRYHHGAKIWHLLQYCPSSVRHLSADIIQKISPGFWDGLSKFVPHAWRPDNVGHKAHLLADVLKCQNYDEYYHRCVSFWPDATKLLQHKPQAITSFTEQYKTNLKSPIERMQYWDMLTYLPDDILCKVDRASMAVSLESRVPLLDHRVVEFCWHLPMNFKIRDGQTKWILRQVLERHVPRQLFDRPKKGFGVPIDAWLRNGLRDWAEDLLNETTITQQNLLNPVLIMERWQQHISGQRNWSYSLWGILMFQAWQKRWSSAISS